MAVSIEPYASADALDAGDRTAAAAVFNAAWADWVPGNRSISEAAFLDVGRLTHAPEVVLRYLARDDTGRLVGLGELGWRDNEPEPGACVAKVMVDPAARRSGVGRALVTHLAEVAKANGRIGLTLEVVVDSPADALCEAAGLKRDLVVDLNRADAHAAPDELLAEWIATGEQAEGYSLVTYDDRCPEELAAAFVAAHHVMNDAPRFEGEPASHFTVDELRAVEEACQAARQDWWSVGVRHDATGDIVGLSHLFLPVARPWIAFQGDTGVHDTHRGHRLGAWMKAVNHLRLRRERPDVELIETWNASANAPMLRINHALGFQPAQQFRAWYLPFT